MSMSASENIRIGPPERSAISVESTERSLVRDHTLVESLQQSLNPTYGTRNILYLVLKIEASYTQVNVQYDSVVGRLQHRNSPD